MKALSPRNISSHWKQYNKEVPYEERWENDTVRGFLEAMLSGAGYEPENVQEVDSCREDAHPDNPWTFFASLLEYGRMYE